MATILCLMAEPGVCQKYLDTGVKPSSFDQRLKKLGDLSPDSPAKDAVVGDLGNPAGITFYGIEVFEADAIRKALARDHVYQSAARPSAKLSDFVKVLAKQVEEGYERAGYSTRATVSLVGGPVVVVKEGNQGHLRHMLAADERSLGLAARLRTPEIERGWSYGKRWSRIDSSSTRQQAFIEGRVVRLDDAAIKPWATHVAACLLDEGYRPSKRLLGDVTNFSKVARAPVPTLDFLVRAPAAGPALRIGEITIDGLTRHSRDEVLKLIGVAEGDPLRAEALQQVCDRLAGCYRFWRYNVAVDVPPEPDRYSQAANDAPLTIRVVEYDGVPKLGEKLDEVQQAVIHAADWTWRSDSMGEDILLEYSSANLKCEVVLSPSKNAFAIDMQGTLVSAKGPFLTLDHSLIASTDVCLLADWRRAERVRLTRLLEPQFRIASSRGYDRRGRPAEGRWSVQLGLKNNAGGAPFRLELDKMSFLHWAQNADATYLQDGVLIVEKEGEASRFDAASGRPLEWVFPDNWEEGDLLTVTFKSGEYTRRAAALRKQSKRFTDRCDQAHPWFSLAMYALDQLEGQPLIDEHPLAPLALRAARLLAATPEGFAWIESCNSSRPDDSADGPPKFIIPVASNREASKGTLNIVSALPAMADRSFPRGSWAWTSMREYGLLSGPLSRNDANRNRAGQEFDRLAAKGLWGPISGLVVAHWMKSKRSNAAVTFVARHALKQQHEEGLLNDLQPFISGDLLGATLTEQVILFVSTLDDEQRGDLLDTLPAIVVAPMKRLLDRRKANPTEPPRDALREAVLLAWRGGWREEVKAELASFLEQGEDG